jgi:hypothetical protein
VSGLVAHGLSTPPGSCTLLQPTARAATRGMVKMPARHWVCRCDPGWCDSHTVLCVDGNMSCVVTLALLRFEPIGFA